MVGEVTTTAAEGSTNSTSAPEDEAGLVSILMTSGLVLETLVTMILDAVCVVALLRRRLHKEENRFIFMTFLALAEMLVGSTFFVQFITGYNYMLLDLVTLIELDTTGCIVLNCASSLFICIGMIGLLLVTADQYMRIEFSLKYPTYATRRNAFILIAIAFVFVTIDLVVQIVRVVSSNAEDQCSFVADDFSWFYVYGLLAFVVMPFGLIALMNGRIWYLSITQFRKMKRMQHVGRFGASTPHVVGKGDTGEQPDVRREAPQGHSLSPDPPPSRRHWRTTITVAILVGSLVLCWAPMTVCMTMATMGEVDVPQMVLGPCAMVCMANYLLTPIIYVVRVPEVKAELKRMFPTCHVF